MKTVPDTLTSAYPGNGSRNYEIADNSNSPLHNQSNVYASFRILPEITVQPLHQLHSTEVPKQIGSFYQIKIMSSELNAPPTAKTGIIGMHTFTWNHF